MRTKGNNYRIIHITDWLVLFTIHIITKEKHICYQKNPTFYTRHFTQSLQLCKV